MYSKIINSKCISFKKRKNEQKLNDQEIVFFCTFPKEFLTYNDMILSLIADNVEHDFK